MGESARIEGMKIKMYPFDAQKHKQPHFLVILANGKNVSVAISDGRVLEGHSSLFHHHSSIKKI
jgi:hypothetical protein